MSLSLRLVPVVTPHFFHGVLVSFECLVNLLFRYKSCLQHILLLPLDLMDGSMSEV